jgi:membrane-associated phospholipid phosphatase
LSAFEWIATGYFAGLALAAAAVEAPMSRRLRGVSAALGAALTVAAIARFGNDGFRAWAPHAYLVTGYWLPALLTQRLTAATRFERWLVASDARLRPLLPDVPAPLVHVAELAYLVCYAVVPASFAVVWVAGTTLDVQRFWAAVLLAGYACYGSLPWLLSRPPRAIGARQSARHVGAVNVFVLRCVSHELNTFPSGHVAVSFAAALVAWTVMPVAGALVALVAAAIAIGAAAGRYHYVIDVVVGLGVALIAGAIAIRG